MFILRQNTPILGARYENAPRPTPLPAQSLTKLCSAVYGCSFFCHLSPLKRSERIHISSLWSPTPLWLCSFSSPITQHINRQDPHLDYSSRPRRPRLNLHSFRHIPWAPLRLRDWLSLYVCIHPPHMPNPPFPLSFPFPFLPLSVLTSLVSLSSPLLSLNYPCSHHNPCSRTQLPQNPRSTRQDPALDRSQARSPRPPSLLRQHRPEDIWQIWRLADHFERDFSSGRGACCWDGVVRVDWDWEWKWKWW